jgi:hypothetical protein
MHRLVVLAGTGERIDNCKSARLFTIDTPGGLNLGIGGAREL